MIENLVFLIATLAGPIIFFWSASNENKEREKERQAARESFNRNIGRP
jgi:flagellar basal body-associated protein FliL